MKDPLPVKIELPDSEISYYADFLKQETAGRYFKALLERPEWEQHFIRIFGKRMPQPRLSALYAANAKTYTYSGLSLQPLPFPQEIAEIRQKLWELTGLEFTHCLANLYRDGSDSMGWHSDDEKELGINPVIASVSLGEKRKFHLKHKSRALTHHMELEHGSLLMMAGKTQHFWKHQLPKTKRKISARINLTFRKIL